jgi:hypothetical protein
MTGIGSFMMEYLAGNRTRRRKEKGVESSGKGICAEGYILES